jgi:hypothetical protein
LHVCVGFVDPCGTMGCDRYRCAGISHEVSDPAILTFQNHLHRSFRRSLGNLTIVQIWLEKILNRGAAFLADVFNGAIELRLSHFIGF